MSILSMSPKEVRDAMLAAGIRRAYVVWDRTLNRPRASHRMFDPVADAFAGGFATDYKQHEAVFLEIGAVTNTLMSVAVLKTVRGASAGGVRMMRYDTFEAFLHDGLRLAIGMGRKSALAGLWWGGGKGVIPIFDPFQARSRPYRDALFSEYGSFLSSLNGCFVVAEDLGVTTADMDRVHLKTRYCTCISEHLGGNGNPSIKTGWGIVCGMEAALAHMGKGTLAGKTVAVMGCGNVATAMTARLLERGVGRVVAADVNPDSVARFRQRFSASQNVTARVAKAGDMSILYEECDVVSPCAVGGILNPTTIPRIRARIVCGSANNQLLDDTRDDKLMKQYGIRFAPDFVVNRMGIVDCANEQYGRLREDPAIFDHFSHTWENGIFQVTQRVFRHAEKHGITEVEAANKLADEASLVPHPIWAHRGQQIIDELVATKWELQAPLSAKF